MQDIIVYISLDTASKEKETLLPLILSFEGAFAYKEYNKAEDVAKDFTTASSPTLAAAQKLFDQIKVENCPGRTKKDPSRQSSWLPVTRAGTFHVSGTQKS